MKALFAADIPVKVYGVKASLRVCVVAGHTRLSLSRATLGRPGLCADFSQNTASSQTEVGADRLRGRRPSGP